MLPEEHGIYMEDIEEDFRLQEAKEIIKDYFRKTYKDTASIIRYYQSFFNSLATVYEVYIFGHSLSEIDFDYFAEIKKNVPLTCRWYISYHDQYNQRAEPHSQAEYKELSTVSVLRNKTS